jgi:pilus assembly protein CpaF
MQMLLDRIGEAVDLAQLQAAVLVPDALSQQIERAARDQAAAMRTEGEAPEGIDPDALARDAHRELVALGPLSALLEDDDVSEVHCARFDQVVVVRGAQTQMSELAFSSEDALARTVRRLCAAAGANLDGSESFVERRHPRGRFVAVLPPASPASFTFRKRRRFDQSLEDLVRAQCMGRPVATFLEACVQGRANVLVVGQSSELLGALVTASAPQDRIAVVSDTEEFSAPHAHIIATYAQDERAHGEAAVRAAARMRTDRLVVTRLGGAIAQATIESIMAGTSGVLAGVVAPTLRQATSRLVSQLLMARPGLPIEAAREAISEVFDVAVELGRADNGKERVVRVSEMSGTDPKGVALKDIFAAAGDGEALATGSTPRIAGELASRGVKVDPQVFKRR